jgi:hypothetical protein
MRFMGWSYQDLLSAPADLVERVMEIMTEQQEQQAGAAGWVDVDQAGALT